MILQGDYSEIENYTPDIIESPLQNWLCYCINNWEQSLILNEYRR